MTAQEFEDIRKHLVGQSERLIIELRETLMSYDKEDIFGEDATPLENCIDAVVACKDGLKKLSSVMEFIDAWEEIGDIPSLGLVDDKQIIKNFVGGNDDGTTESGGSEGVSGEANSELL